MAKRRTRVWLSLFETSHPPVLWKCGMTIYCLRWLCVPNFCSLSLPFEGCTVCTVRIPEQTCGKASCVASNRVDTEFVILLGSGKIFDMGFFLGNRCDWYRIGCVVMVTILCIVEHKGGFPVFECRTPYVAFCHNVASNIAYNEFIQYCYHICYGHTIVSNHKSNSFEKVFISLWLRHMKRNYILYHIA